MAKTFREWNPGQKLLFPPSVEEFIPVSHPAHFVRQLVEKELDLREIRDTYVEARGAPPFPPAMMVGVFLYAYMRGEYSSRRIARACEERVDFMLLAALNRPDFRTIAVFRKKHHRILGELFKQVVQLCGEAGLIDLKHVAVDGSKIKANAAKDQNESYQKLCQQERAIESSIKEWFEKAEAADAEEDKEFGADERGDIIKDAQDALVRIREAKKRIEQRDNEQREERRKAEQAGTKPKSKTKRRNVPKETAYENKTDPDSRIMKSGTGFVQGYNAQVAVDSRRHVIVSQHVSTHGNDRNEVKRAINGIAITCGNTPRELSADTDYSSEENFKALHRKGIRGYVAVAQGRGPPSGTYTKLMLQRLKKAGRRSRYSLRKQVVEPVIGIIKAARGFRQFLLRGVELVSSEWALVCTAQNLWKLFAARTA